DARDEERDERNPRERDVRGITGVGALEYDRRQALADHPDEPAHAQRENWQERKEIGTKIKINQRERRKAQRVENERGAFQRDGQAFALPAHPEFGGDNADKAQCTRDEQTAL